MRAACTLSLWAISPASKEANVTDWRYSLLAEGLPSIHKALGSILSSEKKEGDGVRVGEWMGSGIEADMNEWSCRIEKTPQMARELQNQKRKKRDLWINTTGQRFVKISLCIFAHYHILRNRIDTVEAPQALRLEVCSVTWLISPGIGVNKTVVLRLVWPPCGKTSPTTECLQDLWSYRQWDINRVFPKMWTFPLIYFHCRAYLEPLWELLTRAQFSEVNRWSSAFSLRYSWAIGLVFRHSSGTPKPEGLIQGWSNTGDLVLLFPGQWNCHSLDTGKKHKILDTQ